MRRSFQAAAVLCIGALSSPATAQCDPVWAVDGPYDESFWTSSLWDLGDLDGDGSPELMSTYSAGVGVGVRIFSSVDGAELLSGGDYTLGVSAARLGDLDGDGIGEWLQGLNGEVVYLVSGLQTVVWWELGEVWTESFGSAVFPCGDLNGDGVSEFVIGDSSFDDGGHVNDNYGRAIVYNGASRERMEVLLGEAGQSLGAGGAEVGDLSGDGVSDILVYGRGWDGVVRAFSGADFSPLYTVNLNGRFGSSIAVVGDTDGDGVTDYVCGAPTDGDGIATLLSGATGAPIVSRAGPEPIQQVVALGDWNGDGIGDVGMCCPRDDAGGPDSGRLVVCSGDDLRVIARFQGPVPGERFASAAAAVEGLPGQTAPMVVVGSSHHDSGRGLARLLGSRCPADFNCDGVSNTLDVLSFLNAFVAGDLDADVNFDDVVNTQDVLAFLNLWTVGC